ncbi:helix-turn-helix transcriptional regulator [Micromonospora sp. NBC_01655]|uniref:helix-turn-helix domain-containing protein n=1 Tax=Micromonospora sp. NBC_01655 TaxID=2975983 RepID=UPI0022548430|nr:helix-turn-helix transcriptional regulator [Micromonospora sp. NBC_01655]MCX4473557.1 helix-turn-helix transcriptional regulator [Micromonospora sp. NBC_01655]
MARQERPVDPTAGPVQALAYELRKLRAEAGNPTYRQLARSAGYGATTLSEAAGGARLPTLEVLLAYVGACGGDPDEWRRRWHEAAARARPTEPVRQAAGERDGHPEEGGGAGAPGPDRPAVAPSAGRQPGSGTPRPRRRWVVPVVAVAAAIGTVVTVVDLPDDVPTAPGAARCPAVPDGTAFTAVTYGGGAHVRAGAARDASVLTTIPPDCTVGFTGFCVGEKVYDNTGGMPDVRWFKVAGGGVVSSAVLHGNPPRDLRASDCRQGRPTSTGLELSVVTGAGRSGAVTLRATGRDLYVVGFTTSAGDPASPGERTWRQVALADVRDPAVGASARLDALPGPSARGPVVLVAAACLGGDSPTGLVRARQVRPEDPREAVPVTLDQRQQAEAARSACRYPSRG